MPATRQARAHAPAALRAQKQGNNANPARLSCTPLRPLHPQRQNYTPQTGPVTLTAVETTGPAGTTQVLRDSDARPCGPCTYIARTKHHGPAQRHSLQWRQPARRVTSTGTVNQRPAQRHPCGGATGPADYACLSQLSPFVSPFVSTASIIQPRTIFKHPGRNNGVHELFTIFGSLKGKLS
jgi:hypothetical protein